MASATTGRATLADISDNFKCVPETPPKTNFLNGMGEIEVADLSNDVELESSVGYLPLRFWNPHRR